MNTSTMTNSYFVNTSPGASQYLTVVRLKAGHVGQVLHSDGEVLWESKPKKTGEKAAAAAKKAQLRAARAAFSQVEG